MAKALPELWEQLAVVACYDSRKLASLCGHSVRKLERDFHSSLDRTPQDWLDEQRIKAAQKLLLSGMSVKAVAFELNFKQPSHFCRQFKSQLHMTPSHFVDQANR